MSSASRRRAWILFFSVAASATAIAIAIAIGACSSFDSSDASAPGTTQDGTAPEASGAIGTDVQTSHCSAGRRATLLASGGARALASDDRGAYWTASRRSRPSRSSSVIRTASAGCVSTTAAPGRSRRLRTSVPAAPRASTPATSPAAWTSHGCDRYQTQFTLQRLAPSNAKLTLDKPGKPTAMISDCVWVYVVYGDATGYSAIWRYSFADTPQNLTMDVHVLGRLALLKDQLVWLSSDGVVRSMATSA